MYRFISAEKANYHVRTLCRVLGVSSSGYYAWCSRPPSVRSLHDAELTRAIVRIHQTSRCTYGRPRIHAELRYEGMRCSGKRVARLMRAAAIAGIPARRRRRGLTRRRPGVAPHPDLVGRRFSAPQPDRLWVADITYVPTGEGWLYLATILDCCSRRIVGWSMTTDLRSELVVDALEMATSRRRPSSGLVHHSDQGSQYVSLAFTRRLEEAGICGSMGGVGSASTMPRRRACSLRSSGSWLTVTASLRAARRGERCLSSSKSSTTAGGSTRASGTSAPRSSSEGSSGRFRRLQLPNPDVSTKAGQDQTTTRAFRCPHFRRFWLAAGDYAARPVACRKPPWAL
jgi:putative transposase